MRSRKGTVSGGQSMETERAYEIWDSEGASRVYKEKSQII